MNVPINIKDTSTSGKCERIEVAKKDSWRVTSKFKFSGGATYEIDTHTMSEERNITVNVIVKHGIASFRTGNRIFKCVFGEDDGKLYCKFKADNLKPLKCK